MSTIPVKNKPKLLLHICCAGCGAYVSKVLAENYELSLFYFNPNIYPESEYLQREIEVKNISQQFNLPLIVETYNHQDWLDFVAGLELEPEKGQRCYKCYEYRMKKLVDKASELNFDYFDTSLSVSPYKVYAYIKQIGESLAEQSGLKYHDQDFKKQDGFKKSVILSKELELYRQDYCGCEFSRRTK